jgi:hypothetical protein
MNCNPSGMLRVRPALLRGFRKGSGSGIQKRREQFIVGQAAVGLRGAIQTIATADAVLEVAEWAVIIILL